MLDVLKFVGGLFILLILLELLDLPEIIGKKIRGEASKKDLREKMKEIENRLEKLEKKIN